MTIQKRPSLRELEELEEDGVPEMDPKTVFERGSIARSIIPQLEFIVGFYMTDPVKAKQIQGFLKWVPGDRLEEYLVLALEYGMRRVMPKSSKATRRAVARR